MKTAKQPSPQIQPRTGPQAQDRPGDHGDQTSVNSRDASQRDPDDVMRVGSTEYHLPNGGVRPYAHPGASQRPGNGDKRFSEPVGKRHGSPWLTESDNRSERRGGHSGRS